MSGKPQYSTCILKRSQDQDEWVAPSQCLHVVVSLRQPSRKRLRGRNPQKKPFLLAKSVWTFPSKYIHPSIEVANCSAVIVISSPPSEPSSPASESRRSGSSSSRRARPQSSQTASPSSPWLRNVHCSPLKLLFGFHSLQ